jgi:MFS family permease
MLARYAAGATLVRTADEGARVALALLALDRTGSAGLGGLLIAVLLVPHVLAAPVVGLLVDRSRRPGPLIAAAAAGFGGSLAFAGLALGRVPAGVVIAVLLAGGCCGPALTGALSSRLDGLVPAGRLPRAFGIDSLTYNTAGIAGPALAAVLAGATSAGTATVVLGGGALAGAAAIGTLPLGRDVLGRTDLLAGLRVVVREPVLATLTLSTSIGQLGAGMLPVVVAVAATRAGNAAAAGWLLTAVAAGGLAGSLLWTRWPARPERAPWWVVAGLAGTGLPVLAGAVSPSLPVLAVLFALSGVADGPLFGALLTTRQRWSPPELRSQVFTLGAGAKITAAAAGAALAGTLSGTATGSQLAVAGAVPLVAAAVGAAGFARSAHSSPPPGRRDPAPPASPGQQEPAPAP